MGQLDFHLWHCHSLYLLGIATSFVTAGSVGRRVPLTQATYTALERVGGFS